MPNVKDAILKKKIGSVIYDLMIKTKTSMVEYSSTKDLATYLAELAADVSQAQQDIADITGGGSGSISDQIDAAITNERDDTVSGTLAARAKSIEDSVAAILDATTGIEAVCKNYTDTGLGLSGTGYSTAKAYADHVGETVSQALAAAFKFKGTVDYVADLSSVTDPANGDVYQVRYRGTSGTDPLNAEYAYDGTNWVELGSVIDLSNYYTRSEVDTVASDEADAAETAAKAYADGLITNERDDSVSGTLAARAKAIEDDVDAINNSSTGILATAEAYTDTAITNERDDSVSGTLAARAKAIEDDVDAINDASTGILATAEAYTDTAVAPKARFLVSATEPADLTESDIWAQIVNE